MNLHKYNDKPFLVLGRAGLDLYADPPGTHIEQAHRFSTALGGSAANIAAGIARLDGKVTLISALSDDAVGRFILNQLVHYKIATEHITIINGEARSSLAIVESRSDDCQSVIYRNGAADFQLSEKQIGAVPYENFGYLIVTGTSLAIEPARTATFLAMQLAKKAGLTVIFDVDYRPYSWENIQDASKIYTEAALCSDVVIGNDTEFAVMAPEDGPGFAQHLSRHEARLVVYKKGEKGSVTYWNNDIFERGIFSVTALKPTGAGDAFMAAFVMGLHEKLPVETCVTRGSAAAAIVVGKVGCAPAMPTRGELNAFIAQHTGA